MRWLLVAGLTGVFVFTAIVCTIWLFARHRVRRHHRVDPKVATGAPLSWSVDPRVQARLHRRLARVGSALGKVIDDHQVKGRRRNRERTPIVDLAIDLRAQAVALDRELSRIALLAPAARRRPLSELAEQVTEIESSCTQLVSLSAEMLAPRTLSDGDPAIAEISQRVDRLAQAQAELNALDDAAGITTTATPATGSTAKRSEPPARSRVARGEQQTAEG